MNYYVGLSLAASSGMDSGLAILDEENNLILVDKLYTMNDVMFIFRQLFSHKILKNLCISCMG